jgi:ribonucleoside-diphosphate reductase beta chain
MQRFETVKYRQFEKLTDKQLGFFWRPEEVHIGRDSKDFKELTEFEQHIFTSNLKRQIILDSVQGRSPNLAFLPICSLPELEAFIETWAFNETIHSRSYTYIIRNIFSDPSKVFDEIVNIPEVLSCANDISRYYDELIEAVNVWKVTPSAVSMYELKKRLWMAIMSVNVLEGIRFYVSFACSWAFAEIKKMEGNAKIIKFICRDENVHLAFTQQVLKLLPQDDPDFIKIAEETKDQCVRLFDAAVQQEKEWAAYLFKDGSMVGLNERLLVDYVEWIANKRMQAIGLPVLYKAPQACPLPWTQKWISGSEVQVAPQETEISSYISGGTKQDVNDTTFKGFNL